MKLIYFGKTIKGSWKKDQHPATVMHTRGDKAVFELNPDGSRKRDKKGRRVIVDLISCDEQYTTDTRADFVFETTMGRTIRIDRHSLPVREDPPSELRRFECPKEWPKVESSKAEAFYEDGAAECVNVHETSSLKRVQAARHNGLQGGRPTNDKADNIKEAVAKVLYLLDYNKTMSMKRACNLAIEKHTLTITWQALQKHVKKALQKNVKGKPRNVTN